MVEYVASFITLDQVLNLFNHGGFSVGVGDWRPEKNGQHGRFKVVAVDTD